MVSCKQAACTHASKLAAKRQQGGIQAGWLQTGSMPVSKQVGCKQAPKQVCSKKEEWTQISKLAAHTVSDPNQAASMQASCVFRPPHHGS
eukprot:1161508-Pelagomonas_calceolata.AAC.6